MSFDGPMKPVLILSFALAILLLAAGIGITPILVALGHYRVIGRG